MDSGLIDIQLMPFRPNARASWNCLMQSSKRFRPAICRYLPGNLDVSEGKDILRDMQEAQKISVTFDMNRLQSIPKPGEAGSPGRVLVSMNPIREPRSVQGRYWYSHPLFSADSIQASKRLHEINGVSNISYAGAWMGFGFHEDGFQAGSHATRHILEATRISDDAAHGVRPLELVKTDQWVPRCGFIDKLNRTMIHSIQYWINTTTGSSIRI